MAKKLKLTGADPDEGLHHPNTFFLKLPSLGCLHKKHRLWHGRASNDLVFEEDIYPYMVQFFRTSDLCDPQLYADLLDHNTETTSGYCRSATYNVTGRMFVCLVKIEKSAQDHFIEYLKTKAYPTPKKRARDDDLEDNRPLKKRKTSEENTSSTTNSSGSEQTIRTTGGKGLKGPPTVVVNYYRGKYL